MKKTLKQTIVSLIIICIIVTTSLPIAYATTNKIVITPSKSSASILEEISFIISISEVQNAKSVGIAVDFGEDFELISGTWLKNGLISNYDTTKNRGVFAYAEPSDMSGELFRLVLRTKNVESKNSNIKINVHMKNDDVDILNETLTSTVSILKNNFESISFKNIDYEYDGTEKSLAVTGTLPTGAKVEYTNEKATNAGTYNATAKITCEGYNDLILNATLKINPKVLTVSGLSAKSKKYDGTDKATLEGGSLNGVVSGDDVTADIPTVGTFATANAGSNIAVSIDDIALTGAKKDNYTLTQPTGLKANIEKAEITVRANDKQMIKGGTMPKLDYTQIGTLFNDDKITGELAVNTDGKPVGEFDITQGTLAVSPNYKLTFEKGKLSVVDKTPQNISVSEITEKTYGDAEFKVEVTKDPVSNLDTFTFASSNPNVAEIAEDGTVTIKSAGETDITVKQSGDDTYAPFEKTQKLVVKKVAITVTADAKSKKIGAADPELTYTYTGELKFDDAFTGALTRQNGEEVGKYDILIGTLAINDNYDITYNKAVFEIFDKTPQNITVADFGEKTYGDATFAISVTADATANLTNYTFESDNTGVAEVAPDGTVTVKAAGEANIKVKEPGDDEYAAFEKSVKLIVKKKSVTVTSVDLDNKTAVIDGVLAEDEEKVALDFDKLNIETGENIDETSTNITLKNFVLKGEKAANYEVATESLAAAIAKENIVDVSITAENGVVTGAAKYLKGSTVTVTATAESGYRFIGWYADSSLVSSESTYTFTADADTALTAKFERNRSTGGGGGGGGSTACTVKFVTNGGNEIKSISVKKGQTIGTIAEPTRDGYVFAGWYTDKELTKLYNKDEKVTASITLYAAWTKDNSRQLILTIGKKDATVFGKAMTNDVAPKIVNDRTMLPARFVAENLGAVVTWNEEKQEVTINGKNTKGEEISILIKIDSDIAYVNDKEVKLDSPAFIENDRTYTPIRFISEELGATVDWNETEQTVTITK